MGVATRHQWYHAVGYSLDDLRLHWAFPQHPNTEDTTTSLRREFNQKAQKAVGGKYAHRVFGYLLPSLTGVYFFHVSFSETSASASVEFWLSPTSSPMRSVLLGYTAVTSKKYNSAVSKGAFLQSCGVYYFEFLEQAYNGRSVAEVMVCTYSLLIFCATHLRSLSVEGPWITDILSSTQFSPSQC
jgi:hypothetical protein